MIFIILNCLLATQILKKKNSSSDKLIPSLYITLNLTELWKKLGNLKNIINLTRLVHGIYTRAHSTINIIILYNMSLLEKHFFCFQYLKNRFLCSRFNVSGELIMI